MRKKLSTDVEGTAAVLELEPDDELVTTTNVTTTKTIGRRKPKPAAEPEPEAIATGATFDDADDDLSNVIDIDPDGDEDDTPTFSENSFAALLYGNAEDDYSSEYFTLIIRREPDDVRDMFLTPCSDQTYIGKMRNISLEADRDDIADKIRQAHGGGRYTLQMHYGGKICKTYPAVIADDPQRIREARTPATPPPPVYAQQPSEPVNPLRQRIEELKLEKEYDELKFGAERRRLERLEAELDELRKRRESGEVVQQSDLAVAVSLLKGNTDPGILDFVKDALNPPEKESGTNVWDVAKYVMENAETIIPVAMSLLGGFMGRPQQAPPPPMFPQPTQPPALEPPPILPNTPMFGRRKSEPEPESEPPASAGGNIDAPETDAEPIEAEQNTEAAND